jgi:D-glycero-D-manno-heptose 1,7-bisphosphate phosphatase
MKRAVFFDRDGVLNRSLVDENGKPRAPKKFEDFIIEPDAADCVQKVKKAGYLAIVITNQPDVGHGLVAQDVVERMHDLLRTAVDVDDIEVCYATRADHSPRMKPAPGMLLDAASKWDILLAESALIGDRGGDIEAGRAAGCGTTVLIERNYPEGRLVEPDFTVSTLVDAVDKILNLSMVRPIIG